GNRQGVGLQCILDRYPVNFSHRLSHTLLVQDAPLASVKFSLSKGKHESARLANQASPSGGRRDGASRNVQFHTVIGGISQIFAGLISALLAKDSPDSLAVLYVTDVQS